MKYIISSCLIGLETRYDGESNLDEKYLQMVRDGRAVPFCPEQAGGLSTPRAPSEIRCGDGFDVLSGKARVITEEGQDVTDNFVKGARETWKLMKKIGAQGAILKSKSPSCGCKTIYDGSFEGKLREGVGVTAAYLMRKGMEVIDSDAASINGIDEGK